MHTHLAGGLHICLAQLAPVISYFVSASRAGSFTKCILRALSVLFDPKKGYHILDVDTSADISTLYRYRDICIHICKVSPKLVLHSWGP